MNRLFLILVVIVAALVQSCTPIRPTAEDTYVYNFVPTRYVPSENPKTMIARFLDARNVGDLYRSDDNIAYYVSKDDVSETFEYDFNTGNITFNKGRKRYAGSRIPELPDSRRSIELAQEFLAKNNMAPLNLDQLKMVHLGGVRSTRVVDGSRAGPVINELVTVNFGRVVDGVPVIGPGSKIVVNIGDKGEVVGVIRRWRELEYATRAVVPAEQAVPLQEAEEMARRQLAAQFGEGTSYRVLASGRRYYDNNGRFLQPVYAFEVTVTLKDPKLRPFDYLCVVPILRDSPEPLNLTTVDPIAKRLIRSPAREAQTSGQRPAD